MNNGRDTREVVNVDAFSQLPFIRSVPETKEKNSSAIRLFGIEFSHETEQPEDSSASSCSKEITTSNNNNINVGDGGNSRSGDNQDNGSSGGGEESNRKFECHYCCRNFPTSQALGGHQNAHKRERQQAKRAHLQSAVSSHYHHHHGGAEGLFGLIDYHSSVPGRFGFGTHYSSWNGSPVAPPHLVAPYPTPRFYGDVPGSMSRPINGNPVSVPYWRNSDYHVGRPVWGGVAPVHPPANLAALPLLGDDSRLMGRDRVRGHAGTGLSPPPSSSPLSGSQNNRIVSETKPTGGVQEHVSLDLHL